MKMLLYWMNIYVYINGLIKGLIFPVGNVNVGREKVASHDSSFLLNPCLNELEGTQNTARLENVCTSWRPEGCVEWKLWVPLIRIFLTVQANVQDLLGGTRAGENAFQCHRNVTFLCCCALCACARDLRVQPAWAAACPVHGEHQRLPSAGYSGEGGGTLFLRPSTPQTASAKVLRRTAKFSFPFQGGENNILILTSAWPLRQCGSGFSPGEIRRDKNIMVYLVAELNCPLGLLQARAVQAESEWLSQFLGAWCFGSEDP